MNASLGVHNQATHNQKVIKPLKH